MSDSEVVDMFWLLGLMVGLADYLRSMVAILDGLAALHGVMSAAIGDAP